MMKHYPGYESVKRLKRIFMYRYMIVSLVRRELKGRYKGSALGFLWTFVNPLLQMLVYTVVFSIIMRSDIDHYYIFLFVVLIPWIFCSSCVSGGSDCVVCSKELVKKIFFPREVLPISFVTASFINMLLAYLVVFAVTIISGFGLRLSILPYLFPVIVVEYFLALGLCFLVSSLTVYFRDLLYFLQVATMLWQFLTPVMYSQERVIESMSTRSPVLLKLWFLNPMTPIINCFRDVMYYKRIPNLAMLTSAVGFSVFFLILGWFTFGKLQRGFAEVL